MKQQGPASLSKIRTLTEQGLLICPRCRAHLTSVFVEELACSSCSAKWPIRDGILDFVGSALIKVEDHQDEQVLPRILNGLIKGKSWEQVCFELNIDDYYYRYLVDSSRGDGLFLLPFGKSKVFLDVGCGFGTIAFTAAPLFRLVIAVDVSFTKLKAISLRAANEGKENVIPIRADALNLPFQEGSIDAVMLNGVLEWLGQTYCSDQPTLIQLKTLKKIRQLLKPGGRLFIGIENRYGLKYLLGYPEDHVRMRFIGVLPRWIANQVHKAKFGYPLRVYTFMVGTKQITSFCGFLQCAFLLAGYGLYCT